MGNETNSNLMQGIEILNEGNSIPILTPQQDYTEKGYTIPLVSPQQSQNIQTDSNQSTTSEK